MRKGMVNCVICGSEYEVCRRCPTTTKNTPWRVICDTPVHYQVYHIIQEVKSGVITKEEAKDMLAYIHVTKDDVESFLPGAKNVLLPIFDEPKYESRKRSRKASVVEEIIEEPVIEVQDEPVFEIAVEPVFEEMTEIEE